MIEKALTTLLTTDTLLSGLISTRVYPIRTPDNVTFPCVVYQRIQSDRAHTLEDAGNLTFSRFVVDGWAAKNPPSGSYAQALAIGRAIQAILDGYRGTVEMVDIQGILQINETHTWEPEIEVYRVSQTWQVIHRE